MCCRRWGFYGFMKDLFTAPDEVMRYLCQNYHLHDIPLGNDWTDKNADKVGVDLGTVVSLSVVVDELIENTYYNRTVQILSVCRMFVP